MVAWKILCEIVHNDKDEDNDDDDGYQMNYDYHIYIAYKWNVIACDAI